jgi:hypothetical protein
MVVNSGLETLFADAAVQFSSARQMDSIADADREVLSMLYEEVVEVVSRVDFAAAVFEGADRMFTLFESHVKDTRADSSATTLTSGRPCSSFKSDASDGWGRACTVVPAYGYGESSSSESDEPADNSPSQPLPGTSSSRIKHKRQVDLLLASMGDELESLFYCFSLTMNRYASVLDTSPGLNMLCLLV